MRLTEALAEGKIARLPCDRCGGEGEPLVRRGEDGAVHITGWRCFACRHLPPDAYYIYVVELSNRAGKNAVYVGQSALFPAERFSQHLTGYKAASVVKRFGVRLRPDLFQQYNPIPSRADSEEMEVRLAERLRQRGFRVFGGH